MILAFDTTGNHCSVALAAEGSLVAHRSQDLGRGHAEALLPMVGDCLADAGVGMETVTRLAVTIGPGSFTGVRVGISAARGLALALGVPVVGITTLELLAYCYGQAQALTVGEEVLALMDARRGQTYSQRFAYQGEEARPQPLVDAVALSHEESTSIYGQAKHVAGAGSLLGRPEVEDISPDAGPLAMLAGHLRGEEKVAPFYIRPPDATPAGLRA